MSFTFRRYALPLIAMMAFAAGGCTHGDNAAVHKQSEAAKAGEIDSYVAQIRNSAPAPPAAPADQPGEPAVQRYVAERRQLDVVASELTLPKAWAATVASCESLACEVVSSNLTTQSAGAPPTGEISMRVAPADLRKLLDEAGKLARIVQQTTTREDKTAAVVDTEAKIRNLTAFRDNLRAMMSRPGAKVSELLDIQQRLTATQAQIDCEAGLRKILANETEKVAVDISFRVDSPFVGQGTFTNLWNALHKTGAVLADSTAALITIVVAVLPWLFALALLLWLGSLVIAWWHRRSL